MPKLLPIQKAKEKEPEADQIFEKTNKDAIYVPFSYLGQSNEIIKKLKEQKNSAKAAAKLSKSYTPVLVSLCKKILDVKRGDRHKNKHPVLEMVSLQNAR